MPTMSGVAGARRHTLAEYMTHVDGFGSECVLETAAADLPDRELGELAAYVGHKERVSIHRRGVWQHHGQEVRVCEACGKDLPKNASRRMRYHAHCRERLKKRRSRQRSPDLSTA
jgi:hypothetical protein